MCHVVQIGKHELAKAVDTHDHRSLEKTGPKASSSAVNLTNMTLSQPLSLSLSLSQALEASGVQPLNPKS